MNHEDLDQQIGQYLLVKKLGEGRFGCVYQAQHVHLSHKFAAIKVFSGNVGNIREKKRFLREAQILDQLHHPAILSIIDVDIQTNLLGRDLAYLITELAPHGSLRDRLNEMTGPMSLEETRRILWRLGDGLVYAHSKDIVHRDLKPENILFNEKGDALLADFGIAVVLESGTQTEERMGTLAYMAPEQIEGKVSKRSDQYALACIAYELLTGQRPFAGRERESLAHHHLHTRPLAPRRLNPSLPVSVEKAILRAMEKNREDRYPDIHTFLTALHSTSPLSPADPAIQRRSITTRLPREERDETNNVRQQDWPGAYSQPRRQRIRIVSRGNHIPQIVQPPRVAPLRRQRELPLAPFETPPTRQGRPTRIPISTRRNPPRFSPIADHSSFPYISTGSRRRDWRLILYGVLGSVLLGTGFIILQTHPMMFLLFYLCCLLLILVGSAGLFLCFVRALVSSYRAKKWKWLLALLAGPLGLGILGLIFGSIGGLSLGLLLGFAPGVVIGMVYGWYHSPSTTGPL